MSRDRTPSFWTSDPVGQLPRGQGELTFPPAAPAPECDESIMECPFCGETDDVNEFDAAWDGQPRCSGCREADETFEATFGPEDDGYMGCEGE